MSQTREEIAAEAANGRMWFEEYVAAGFTEEQAMRLITRPMVMLHPTEHSPELNQAMSKMAMIFDRQLAEDLDE